MTATPRGLVVDGQVRLQRCALYAHQHAVTELHHICPKSWFEHAGKPVTSPLIRLCPNCHLSAHAALDGLLAGRDVSLLPARCIKLARQALAIAAANGLTPAPTL